MLRRKMFKFRKYARIVRCSTQNVQARTRRPPTRNPVRPAVYFEPVAAAAELPAEASGVGVNPNHCAAGWVSGRM